MASIADFWRVSSESQSQLWENYKINFGKFQGVTWRGGPVRSGRSWTGPPLELTWDVSPLPPKLTLSAEVTSARRVDPTNPPLCVELTRQTPPLGAEVTLGGGGARRKWRGRTLCRRRSSSWMWDLRERLLPQH